VVTYRDRQLGCPRCGKRLERTTRHENWPCPGCGGVAVGVGELIRLLGRYAPDLLPRGGVAGLETPVRLTTDPPLRCAACSRPMDPVELHDVKLERCYQDELLWLDANQLDVVIDAAIADAESRKGWGQRLRDLLFAN
jgi:Zn-finger nucleic acid-binding protein